MWRYLAIYVEILGEVCGDTWRGMLRCLWVGVVSAVSGAFGPCVVDACADVVYGCAFGDLVG